MAGDTIADSPFMETLPSTGCPPDDAVQVAYPSAWRYVSANPPKPDDFASHAALGKPKPPKVTECRWASCSLFLADNGDYRALPKPRKKFKFVAEISVTANCGFTKRNDDHIDFWRFKTFKPSIKSVIAL